MWKRSCWQICGRWIRREYKTVKVKIFIVINYFSLELTQWFKGCGKGIEWRDTRNGWSIRCGRKSLGRFSNIHLAQWNKMAGKVWIRECLDLFISEMVRWWDVKKDVKDERKMDPSTLKPLLAFCCLKSNAFLINMVNILLFIEKINMLTSIDIENLLD